MSVNSKIDRMVHVMLTGVSANFVYTLFADLYKEKRQNLELIDIKILNMYLYIYAIFFFSKKYQYLDFFFF